MKSLFYEMMRKYEKPKSRGPCFVVTLWPVLGFVAWGAPVVMVVVLLATKGNGDLDCKATDAIRLCLLVFCITALGGGPDGYRASFKDIHATGASNMTITNVSLQEKANQERAELENMADQLRGLSCPTSTRAESVNLDNLFDFLADVPTQRGAPDGQPDAHQPTIAFLDALSD